MGQPKYLVIDQNNAEEKEMPTLSASTFKKGSNSR